MPSIQSYQLQGTVTAMDRDSKSKNYVAGSRQCINVFELNIDKQYWFDSKLNIRKVSRNTPQIKPMVFDLAWNKSGQQYLAVGTTCGSVYVYDLASEKNNPFFTDKGLGSTVKRIAWEPNKTDVFYSLYHENCIVRFDLRSKEKPMDIFQDETTVKFKDFKFNPFDPHVIAVGEYSDQIKLFDTRKMKGSFIVQCRNVADQMGSIIDWDPFDKNRLASAGRKEINFWNWEGSELKQDGNIKFYGGGTLKQQMLIDHFLIKSFKFLQTKQDYYAISQQYIYFYNMKNTDFPERIYGGNSKIVDCWLTDHQQQMIVSASQPKTKTNIITKPTKMPFNPNNTVNTVIVAQYQDNFFSANQERQNHPIAFDSDNCMVFSWKEKGKSTIFSYQGLLYQPHGAQQKRKKLSGLSIKEQLQYLDRHYIRIGKEQLIAETNSKIALELGKKLCSQMWLNIFPLTFPKQSQPHTITSVFEQQLIGEAQIINNCLMIKKKNRVVQKFDICSFLQEIVDQGQLQTAVIAAICLNLTAKKKGLEEVIPKEFMQKIIHPYVEILSSLQMYVIATHTLIETELDTFKNGLKDATKFSISCGVCKANLSKSEPHKDICSAACLDCRKVLDDRLVISCIYCGHGGHADEFRIRVEEGETKCLSCQHQCFTKQKIIIQQNPSAIDFQAKDD